MPYRIDSKGLTGQIQQGTKLYTNRNEAERIANTLNKRHKPVTFKVTTVKTK